MFSRDFLRIHDCAGHRKEFGRFYLLIWWMTFFGVMQIMDNDLTHMDVWWSGGGQIVAAGIAEKWWRQYMRGFDGGAVSTWSRASG